MRGRIQQIKGISKEEAALQRVADEVERNLAASSAGGPGGGGGKGAVTLDAVQMGALRVYAILHPILQGILRRLKVRSLRTEPLPLYEATTQPIIAIVLGWAERNFSRLLHVLTCEDRVHRVKWRMAFLSIKVRGRIAATEADLRSVRADSRTMGLIRSQLSEYWLILKGATSCRQHAEALRRSLQTAHMGSTPEKQRQLQRAMLATVTALEDEAEGYVRRTAGNTFRARRQEEEGFDAALFTDCPQLAEEARAYEGTRQRLKGAIDSEAARRNARSAWAGIVLARPASSGGGALNTSAEFPPLDPSTDVGGGSLLLSPSSSSTRVRSPSPPASPPRLVMTPGHGSNVAGASKVNRILDGVAKDQTARQRRAYAEAVAAGDAKGGAATVTAKSLRHHVKRAGSNSKRGLVPPVGDPRAEGIAPTLLAPMPNSYHGHSAEETSCELPLASPSKYTGGTDATRQALASSAAALAELRQLHAVATNAERAVASRGAARSIGRVRAPKGSAAAAVYGCDLGPVVGPQSSRLLSSAPAVASASVSPSSKAPRNLPSLPRPTTTMVLKTDSNHASTHPSYVARIIGQYDAHVLSNCVPEHIDKGAKGHAAGPFDAFNSERGRVVVDSAALPTDTPLETATRRLL